MVKRPMTSPSTGTGGCLQQKAVNPQMLPVPKSRERGIPKIRKQDYPLLGNAQEELPLTSHLSKTSAWVESRSGSESEFDGFGNTHIPEDAIEDCRNLHPVVRAAKEDTFCISLVGCDLTRNRKLLDHFKKYQLTDFFDDKGQRRYQNLSMSFAAKHNLEFQCAFGSTSIAQPGNDLSKSNVHLSARAFRLATASVQKDKDKVKQRMQDEYHKLDDVKKLQCEDIKRRQHEMLFLEVANHEPYLPSGIRDADLLPLDVSRPQEREERKRFERLNALVLEVATKTEWPGEGAHVKGMTHPLTNALQQLMLKKEHVFEILCSIASWTSAAGVSSHMGVDRSVFCRYILGLGLIDQHKLPYVWAVSVFDQFAKPIRISGFCDCEWNPNVDNSVNDRVAFAPQLSKWDFVNVMDTLIRCRYVEAELNDVISSMREATARLAKDWSTKDGDRACSTPASASVGKVGCATPKKSNIVLDAITAAPVVPQEELRGGAQDTMVVDRQRLITGMLSEPEVLQIVEQFRPVFQELFDLYAHSLEANVEDVIPPGETQDMDFVHFLQFCQDFRIVPCLVTTHEVSRAYHLAECVDVSVRTQIIEQKELKLQDDDKNVNPEMRGFAELVFKAFQDLSGAFLAFNTRRNGEISIAELRLGAGKIGFAGNYKTVFSELADHGKITQDRFSKLSEYVSADFQASLEFARTGKSRGPKLESARYNTAPGRSDRSSRESIAVQGRISDSERHSLAIPGGWDGQKMQAKAEQMLTSLESFSHVGAARNTFEKVKRKQSNHSINSQQSHRSQTRGHGNKSLLPTLGDKSSLLDPFESPSKSSSEVEEIHTATFGVGAFVETLGRIGLSYLLVHGNAVQLATSSRAKMVWLIVYLQAALEHLRQSVDRHLNRPRSADEVEYVSENSQRKCMDQPRVISERLAKVSERLTLQAFKDLEPMALQLAEYSLHPSQSEDIIVAETTTKHERRASQSSRRRRKSASDLISNDSVLNNRRFSVNRVQSPSTPISQTDPGTPRQKQRHSVPSGPSSPRGYKSTQVIVPSSGKNVLGAAEDAFQCSKQSQTNYSKQVTPDRVKEDRLPEEHDQEKKEDIVQSSISHRPAPPRLRDDNFKFDDLLFKRLLQKKSPARNLAQTSPLEMKGSPESPNLVANGSYSGSVKVSIRRSGLQFESTQIPERSFTPSELVRPQSITLSQERSNLLNGLRHCIGKLDRCDLTPPPMSAYATQLNERLDFMMGWSSEHPKPHSAPCGLTMTGESLGRSLS